MAGGRLTTVGHTVKERLAPVEGRVKSDRHPEIAGSAQQEAGQQSKHSGVEQSDPILSRVAVMRVAEIRCRENCSGPETDASREREEPVSTSAEFFLQSYKDENERVDVGPLPDVGAVKRGRPKMKDAGEPHSH